MSKEFVDAIVGGNNLEAEKAFQYHNVKLGSVML